MGSPAHPPPSRRRPAARIPAATPTTTPLSPDEGNAEERLRSRYLSNQPTATMPVPPHPTSHGMVTANLSRKGGAHMPAHMIKHGPPFKSFPLPSEFDASKGDTRTHIILLNLRRLYRPQLPRIPTTDIVLLNRLYKKQLRANRATLYRRHVFTK